MNIALIAHDDKKELMVQFCIAYYPVLAKHNVCANSATGNFVSHNSGLPIHCYLSDSPVVAQQIVARVSCNEIDLVLLFRDTIDKPHDQNEVAIMRLCDIHNIPLATNIATAEVLIHALDRGDFDWRNIVNPSYSQQNKSAV